MIKNKRHCEPNNYEAWQSRLEIASLPLAMTQM
jgi:hypothetical protein